MRLPRSALGAMKCGAFASALALGVACSSPQELAREPVARLRPEPVAAMPTVAAIVPLPVAPTVVAVRDEPRSHPKRLRFRTFSGVGCGRG